MLPGLGRAFLRLTKGSKTDADKTYLLDLSFRHSPPGELAGETGYVPQSLVVEKRLFSLPLPSRLLHLHGRFPET